VTAAGAAALPELVRGHLERALPGETTAPRRVRLTQRGEMWERPGGRALRFTATESLSVERVEFSWRARFPVGGPIALKVVDGYADGAGRLEARVLGVPVQRSAGPELTIGEAMRYLAELPWVPHAIAHNSELEWRELDERRVEVASRVGGETVAVELELDADGMIVRASSRTRPRQVGSVWVPTPWAGEFGGYEELGGILVPTRAEVSWELRGGPFVYWRAAVTSLELDLAEGDLQ
jgi:hypothetical protein